MQSYVWWILGAVLIPGVLFGLDRLLLWMEREGWIYYRKTSSGASAASGVLFAINPIEPDKQYLVEAKSEERKEWLNEEEDGEGDGRDPYRI